MAADVKVGRLWSMDPVNYVVGKFDGVYVTDTDVSSFNDNSMLTDRVSFQLMILIVRHKLRLYF